MAEEAFRFERLIESRGDWLPHFCKTPTLKLILLINSSERQIAFAVPFPERIQGPILPNESPKIPLQCLDLARGEQQVEEEQLPPAQGHVQTRESPALH